MFITEIIAYPLPSSNKFEEIKKFKACVQCTRLVKYEFFRNKNSCVAENITTPLPFISLAAILFLTLHPLNRL